MPDNPFYQGREQTYLKHLFLEKYFEKFTYKLGNSVPEIWYIDGFSGPWESKDPNHSDTSFSIAYKTMAKAIGAINANGKYPKASCCFIEREHDAYNRLESAVNQLNKNRKIDIQIMHGDFESHINNILLNFGPRAFAFFFIDPTGWTGFSMNKMRPILKRRGSEVLINFMFDFINRFIDPNRSGHEQTFNDLFGDDSWKTVITSDLSGEERESAIIKHYCACLKKTGQFKHVTYTRVLYPGLERTIFYLILGTHDTEGIRVFRSVEAKFTDKQEEIRDEKINPDSLFSIGTRFYKIRDKHMRSAELLLTELLRQKRAIDFEEVESKLLEIPYVTQKQLQEMLRNLENDLQMIVQGKKSKERTIKKGHLLIWNSK